MTPAAALVLSTLAFNQNTTFDVEETSVTTGDIRGDNTSPGFASNVQINKTGPGTLIVGGSAGSNTVAGTTLNINQGIVQMTTFTALGGNNTIANLNINLASGTELIADFDNATNRSGGYFTFNNNTEILRPNDGGTAETGFIAASSADVVTINGNVLFDDANIETSNVDQNLSFQNPVVVNSGAVLTLENDDTGGFSGNDAINFQ